MPLAVIEVIFRSAVMIESCREPLTVRVPMLSGPENDVPSKFQLLLMTSPWMNSVLVEFEK